MWGKIVWRKRYSERARWVSWRVDNGQWPLWLWLRSNCQMSLRLAEYCEKWRRLQEISILTRIAQQDQTTCLPTQLGNKTLDRQTGMRTFQYSCTRDTRYRCPYVHRRSHWIDDDSPCPCGLCSSALGVLLQLSTIVKCWNKIVKYSW